MDSLESRVVLGVHGGIVVNPDGTNIGDPIPTNGNNPSNVYTETILGTITTTVVEKTIGATTYTKTYTEDTNTGITTETEWI